MSKCKVYCCCSINIDLDDDILISALVTRDFFVLTNKTSEKIKEKLKNSEIEYENLLAIHRKNIVLWEE